MSTEYSSKLMVGLPLHILITKLSDDFKNIIEDADHCDIAEYFENYYQLDNLYISGDDYHMIGFTIKNVNIDDVVDNNSFVNDVTNAHDKFIGIFNVKPTLTNIVYSW